MILIFLSPFNILINTAQHGHNRANPSRARPIPNHFFFLKLQYGGTAQWFVYIISHWFLISFYRFWTDWANFMFLTNIEVS